ncbi:molybdopterin-dependent oxidoreductase [Inquilinus limosus]|uniref:molybdopterin-dependent oxidoreductase n=1 Tax=Inquilinus limosus TaxID=171674 RepID=UPI003F140E07
MLDALPGKKPLIKLSYRPPNYETPLEYFSELLTPNDAFFVRYHLADIPEVDVSTWKLAVGGDAAEGRVEYTLQNLQSDFEQIELVAVNQCSGNRRGLSNPHVQGVEWGYGAMGNARWKGVRLKDVLEKAGVKKEAIEVAFDGADRAVVEKTPDFIKSIPIWRALDENTLLAWEMNGEPLPHWNGYPLRVVVPGWTGTYWVKHLTSIDVRAEPQGGYWMNPAYRIPKSKFALVDRFLSQETDANTPITEMVVNSLITNLTDNTKVAAGQPVEVKGIAWDGGYGIQTVEVSTDGGESWRPAALGEDFGRFSFRPWSYRFAPTAGTHALMVKATNGIGASQPVTPIFNPAGYHHNAVQKIAIVAA